MALKWGRWLDLSLSWQSFQSVSAASIGCSTRDLSSSWSAIIACLNSATVSVPTGWLEDVEVVTRPEGAKVERTGAEDVDGPAAPAGAAIEPPRAKYLRSSSAAASSASLEESSYICAKAAGSLLFCDDCREALSALDIGTPSPSPRPPSPLRAALSSEPSRCRQAHRSPPATF